MDFYFFSLQLAIKRGFESDLANDGMVEGRFVDRREVEDQAKDRSRDRIGNMSGHRTGPACVSASSDACTN